MGQELFQDIIKEEPKTEKKTKGTKGAKTPPVRNLDIFQAMSAVDMNNGGWFEKQSDAAKKEFAAPVFLRWVSTIDGKPDEAAYMLQTVNNNLNLNMWDISDHPELIFRLAASCGLGYKRKATWIKGPERKNKTSKLHGFISDLYPFMNNMEIELLLNKYTKETFYDFLLFETGLSESDSKDMLKLFVKWKSE